MVDTGIGEPMADQETSIITRGILDSWVYRHCSPNIIRRDQGANVEGSEIRNALAIQKGSCK